MPKPFFRSTPTEGGFASGKDVRELALQLGESAGSLLLGLTAIKTTETVVPHNMGFPARWRLYRLQGNAVVYETKAPDAQYFYLAASVAVTTGIEAF